MRLCGKNHSLWGRDGKKGKGVAILVKETIRASEIKIQSTNNFEIIVVEIQNKDEKKF